jgi:hypothetical protein
LHIENLALDLFCNRWLHFLFFGILCRYCLVLCWYRLELVVLSCRFNYTRWLHCFCTILFWPFCIGISVLLE